jgi:hypothetical protein
LIQWSTEGLEKPIAFGSAGLNSTLRHGLRFSIEREAYAVIYALRKFKSITFRAEVVVFTDHDPLSYFNECILKSAKLTRWSLALQEFNLTLKLKSGRTNTAGDCLPRLDEE